MMASTTCRKSSYSLAVVMMASRRSLMMVSAFSVLPTRTTRTTTTRQPCNNLSPPKNDLTTTRFFGSSPKLYRRLQSKKNNNNNNQDTLYRADRVLANRTGKSRSECFDLLKQKRVYQVLEGNDDDNNNGTLQVVSGPSVKLSMRTELRIDKHEHVPLPPPLLSVFHKPKWMLSVINDPKNRRCLDNVLPEGMHPVGRLDYDSSGLLLFSSDGQLTQTLLHPKHEISKTYIATVAGQVDEIKLKHQLEVQGVTTGEGIHTAILQQVQPVDHVQEYLQTVKSNLPKEYNVTDLKVRGYMDIFDSTTHLTNVTLTVTEGKHRMVRRMLANTGYPVVDLQRIQIGPYITLVVGNKDDDDHCLLPVGEIRQLTPIELKWAQSLISQSTASKKVKTKSNNNNNNKKTPPRRREESFKQQRKEQPEDINDFIARL